MSGAAAVPVVAEPSLTEDVEAVGGDGGSYGEGWFCIATDPWPCPAAGCGFVASYLTAVHLVVVWPSGHDSALLANARDARDIGRNPRIVEYRPGFGPCVAWDEWVRRGRPIHARRDRPEGWGDRPSRL